MKYNIRVMEGIIKGILKHLKSKSTNLDNKISKGENKLKTLHSARIMRKNIEPMSCIDVIKEKLRQIKIFSGNIYDKNKYNALMCYINGATDSINCLNYIKKQLQGLGISPTKDNKNKYNALLCYVYGAIDSWKQTN